VPGSSTTSDHIHGAAVDLGVGRGWTVEGASKRLAEMARRGELGDVAQIIEEYKTTGARWVHVGWNHPKRPGRKLQVFVLLDSKRPPEGWKVTA
jgi:hypothetical protein